MDKELKQEKGKTAAQPLLVKAKHNTVTPAKVFTCPGDNGVHALNHAQVGLVREDKHTHVKNPTKSKLNTAALIQDTDHGANGLPAAKHAEVVTQ